MFTKLVIIAHPPKWRFWWTSWHFGRFVHGFGVFGGQVRVLRGLSTEMAGFGGRMGKKC
jgi:hypothetical protein